MSAFHTCAAAPPTAYLGHDAACLVPWSAASVRISRPLSIMRRRALALEPRRRRRWRLRFGGRQRPVGALPTLFSLDSSLHGTKSFQLPAELHMDRARCMYAVRSGGQKSGCWRILPTNKLPHTVLSTYGTSG